MGENLTQLTASQQSLAGVQTGFPVERSFFRSVRCNGMIEVPPQSRYSIFSPVAGFVQSVSHYVGDPVRKGELLTHLSHPELLQKQREFLETSARLRKWEKERARQMELDSSGATSRRLIEEAQAEYEMARAHYQGLRSELQLIGISTQKLEESGELQSRIPLRAPAGGHLSEIQINPGLLVQPQDKLYELVDDDHLHLELQVYSRDLPYIQKDQRVTFQIPGHSGSYQGEVHQVSRVVDPETKTARVHVHFEKAEALSPGVYVQAVIQVGEEKQLAVPEEGILREGDAYFLFLVEGENYRKQQVQAGDPRNGFVPVMDSLISPQTEIVTRGAYYISGSMEGEREHNH